MNPTTVMTALATQIETYLGGTASPVIDDLQVTAEMNINPTPPSIDIYPAEPFQTPFTQGGRTDMTFFVRARVHVADHVAGQQLLLSMMDSTSSASLGQAILADKTLGNTVGGTAVVQVGGFGLFTDIGSQEPRYMGALWTVRVVP